MIEQRGPWAFHNTQNSGYLSGQYLVLERDEKHYFRKFWGFAISREIYEYSKSKGIRYYEIHYLPTMEVMIFNLDDFLSGHRVMFSGEIQYILPKTRAMSIFHVEKFIPQHIEHDWRDSQ